MQNLPERRTTRIHASIVPSSLTLQEFDMARGSKYDGAAARNEWFTPLLQSPMISGMPDALITGVTARASPKQTRLGGMSYGFSAARTYWRTHALRYYPTVCPSVSDAHELHRVNRLVT